jgi:hypothetical protein
MLTDVDVVLCLCSGCLGGGVMGSSHYHPSEHAMTSLPSDKTLTEAIRNILKVCVPCYSRSSL